MWEIGQSNFKIHIDFRHFHIFFVHKLDLEIFILKFIIFLSKKELFMRNL